ncbi:MAG: ATP-NAD kinase family protein [Candidatus Hodarchaeota archaeon]
MKKIGLIVNPIAGMGGSVGLKGTDGDIYKKALELGAKPVSPKRVSQFLTNIENINNVHFLVAPGKMGADFLEGRKLQFETIGVITNQTSKEDTKSIAKLMVSQDIDLLVFCGGDGTARDIYDAIGLEVPVLAIPSGVKMYSPIFAINPIAASEILDAFVDDFIELAEKEVLDINEDSYRQGILDTTLYGYLKVPKFPDLIQAGKDSSGFGNAEEQNKSDIARFIVENMLDDTLYLLGPGTTVKAVSNHLKLPKTLLGIDAVFKNKIIGKDLNEKGILELLNKYNKVKIIITPIGGQGFILGRGNKQFTPKVIMKVGIKNIIIISTREKMRSLKCLRVDTGDRNLDLSLKGLFKIVIGYGEELIVNIEI